jgi:hypothetical protein
MVHGTIREPFAEVPKRYGHAWIVHDGLIKDWQTMESYLGGKYNKKGYPIPMWMDMYQPHMHAEYGSKEAIAKMLEFKHMGPWPD